MRSIGARPIGVTSRLKNQPGEAGAGSIIPAAIWTHWRGAQPPDKSASKPAHRQHVTPQGAGKNNNGGARPICFPQDAIRRAADALRTNRMPDLFKLADAVLVAAFPNRDAVLALLENERPAAPRPRPGGASCEARAGAGACRGALHKDLEDRAPRDEIENPQDSETLAHRRSRREKQKAVENPHRPSCALMCSQRVSCDSARQMPSAFLIRILLGNWYAAQAQLLCMRLPMSGNGVAIQARFSELELDEIENWRRAQRKIPPLAHAVRALVQRGLKAVQDDQSEERAA
jgi:hypothetical protein